MSKKPKNVRKLLRMPCPECNNVQESLNAVCKSCGTNLFVEADHERLETVRENVSLLDEAMKAVANPTLREGNPYLPVDESFKLIRELRKFDHLPGMRDYLMAHRQKLLPFKVQLMQKTVKANMIFLVLLLLFPVVPLLVGWPLVIPLLMLLPTLIWGLVTWKAQYDLGKAKKELHAIQ